MAADFATECSTVSGRACAAPLGDCKSIGLSGLAGGCWGCCEIGNGSLVGVGTEIVDATTEVAATGLGFCMFKKLMSAFAVCTVLALLALKPSEKMVGEFD